MKAVLAAVALTFGVTMGVMNMTKPAQAHRQVTPVEFDDMWDSYDRRCRKNKRKCVEIASTLAFRMAQSGAYTNLNDNEFAAFAIKVAAHIVDNDYTHDENEGSPVTP